MCGDGLFCVRELWELLWGKQEREMNWESDK